jgi:hypothetical protein
MRKYFEQEPAMKNALTIGGALLALAAFGSTAHARMMGGMTMPSSMSRGDIHTPMTSSLGSPRTFSPDGHGVGGRTFSPDGRIFSPDGLQQKVKGSNWKKPIDSDQGGGDDPPPKKSGDGSTQTSSNGSGASNGNGHPPPGTGGYYGGWHHHPPYGGYYCHGKPGC